MSSGDAELRAGIEGRPFEGGAVLELSGTVDVSSVMRLKEEALRLADGGGTVLVDWARCDRIDAAALQTLLALKWRVESRGGALRVGSESPTVRAWLTIAGASALLPAPSDPATAANRRRT